MTYRLTYSITAHAEGLSREQVDAMARENPDTGACDALLLFSIIFNEDGSYCMVPIGLDGRTGKLLSAVEMFKAWALFSCHLAKNEDLTPNRRYFASMVWGSFCDAVFGSKPS